MAYIQNQFFKPRDKLLRNELILITLDMPIEKKSATNGQELLERNVLDY
jgi:hypothetical protein